MLHKMASLADGLVVYPKRMLENLKLTHGLVFSGQLLLALTQAEAAVGDWRLTDCDLYVTKEPCPMCAGALVHVRIRRIIFGCADLRAGAAGSIINLLQLPSLNHQCEITSGVLERECAAILQDFFRKRRTSPSQIQDRHSDL